MSAPVIAIDGPAGVGKGRLAKSLARELGWNLLDSGGIYRALALLSLWRNTAADASDALVSLAAEICTDGESKLRFSADGELSLGACDIEDEIRTEAVAMRASQISAQPVVRHALLEAQRAFCVSPGLIAEGRDMGTVVFPDAVAKIYLDATPEERAKRRYLQLKRRGKNVTFATLFKDLVERDRRDSERAVSPLKIAPEALVIDNSALSADQVFECAKAFVSDRL